MPKDYSVFDCTQSDTKEQDPVQKAIDDERDRVAAGHLRRESAYKRDLENNRIEKQGPYTFDTKYMFIALPNQTQQFLHRVDVDDIVRWIVGIEPQLIRRIDSKFNIWLIVFDQLIGLNT
jgi:hypothetical protein